MMSSKDSDTVIRTMSSKNSDRITVIETESSAVTCEGKGMVKGQDGGNGSKSGVISMMKRPSSWPNLLSDYWFNATNCNYSLESPLKITTTTSHSSSPQTSATTVTVRRNVDTQLSSPQTSDYTMTVRRNVDTKLSSPQTSGYTMTVRRNADTNTSFEKQSPSSLNAGSCNEDSHDGTGSEEEGSEYVFNEGIHDGIESEEESECVVIIGRNRRRNNFIMMEEPTSQFYDDPDEIRFLDEDTHSILLSPQLFSHSSILNPSPENSPTSDHANHREGNHRDGNHRDGNRASTNVGSKEPKPHFPIGEFDFLECEICLRKQWLYRRACCSFPACPDCLKAYFTTKIEQSIVTIECINNFCSSFVHRDEISTRLDQNMKTIYYRLLLSSNSNGLSKTCPQCNHVKTLESVDELKKMRKAAKKDPKAACVTCEQCHYLWCFPCCSPWHEGIKCKQYIRGDLLLQLWAKQMNQGQFNAQKCPKCKIFIQRSSGCDHMHCSRCKTDFCYRCGDQLRRLKFFGDHYSKLSVFGCKYRYKASQPVQRKLIRATVFGSKVLLAPIIGSLALAAGAMVLGLGLAALPLYGGIRFYRKYQSQKFTSSHPDPSSKNFMTSKDVGVQTTVTTVTYFDENGSRVHFDILERTNDSNDEEDIYEHASIFDGRLFDDENGILDSSSYEYNHGINLPGNNNSSSHVRILEEGEDFQDMYPEPISGEEGNYLQFYRSSNKTVSL